MHSKWKNVMYERIGEHRKGDILREKKDKSEGKDDNKRGSKKAIKCKLTQQI